MAFIEKKCSRCHRFNWDSDTNNYNETCTANGYEGQPCDTNGTVYVDGEISNG